MRSSVLVMFLFAALPAATAQVLPVANCSNGGGGGGFGESLGALFSSLVSLSSASNAANDTAGAGEDAAYGLYMCQGDLSGPGCQSCVLTAIAGINQTCAGARRGVIWYDLCLLRYSDNDLFGEVDSAGINMSNPRELTSSLEPYEVMSALVEVAASRRPLMFAANASFLYPIFAIAQCTSDLTSSGFRRCLTSILAFMRTCCLRHKGWRYIGPSCWIRYEATPFFDVTGYTEIIRSRCSADDFPPPRLASDGANLEALVAQLGSNALLSGFYNTTSGDRNAGVLFGLALCRDDPAALPSGACTSCLHRASTAMVGECPNKTQGIMWYDYCLLRYSNQSIFNVVDGEGQTFCSQQSVSPETDNLTMSGSSALVGVAVGRASLFASDVITIYNADTSYVSVQCTRDLSRESCRSCLENGMNRIAIDCHQRKGWQFLSGSCMIRYEVDPFFNLTTALPPAAAPQLPPGGGGGSSQGGRRKRSSNVRIIAVALPIAGLLLLGILLFRAWNLRKKKR